MRNAVILAVVMMVILHRRRAVTYEPELRPFTRQLREWRAMAAVLSLEGLAGNWRHLLKQIDGD